MLRIVEHAHRSDTGRQRDANEDSFFSGAPVFAVADGMGGAQAGEVASRIAAESFQSSERGESAPESYLRQIAEQANERIHSRAQEDSSASGMGTTLTAALVDDDEISLAHVGDSRAYRLRDGELRLLTSDHSLVEELRRQGRLTDEQAEEHPQRSIITRALGPEPEVEVDTMTYRAKPGDVYLLCSDGLTTMIKDDRIAAILNEAQSLDDAVETLVGAANQAGGRDNITVVAFRLDEADVAAAGAADGAGEPAEGATLVGPAAEEAGLTTAGVRRAKAERERERTGDDERARRAARRRREAEAATVPPQRSRRRTALKALVVLVVLAGLIAAAVYGARQVYFLGTDEGGRVALFRGLPYDLPLGIELYSEVTSIPVQVSSLPATREDSVTEHELRSEDDATSLLDDIEASAREPKPDPDRRDRDGGDGTAGDRKDRQDGAAGGDTTGDAGGGGGAAGGGAGGDGGG